MAGPAELGFPRVRGDPDPARAVTMLYVTDVAASRDFYREVVGLVPTLDAGSYVEFAWGNLVLGLRSRDNATGQFGALVAPDRARLTHQITVEVDDPDALAARLVARGTEVVHPPTDQPWGMRSASFLDPDGHLFEVCAALD